MNNLQKGTIFSLILGLRPPRYFASLLSYVFWLHISKIKPLKDNSLLQLKITGGFYV